MGGGGEMDGVDPGRTWVHEALLLQQNQSPPASSSTLGYSVPVEWGVDGAVLEK